MTFEALPIVVPLNIVIIWHFSQLEAFKGPLCLEVQQAWERMAFVIKSALGAWRERAVVLSTGREQIWNMLLERIEARGLTSYLACFPNVPFQLFKDDIRYLLTMDKLWRKRKPPIPLDWNEIQNQGKLGLFFLIMLFPLNAWISLPGCIRAVTSFCLCVSSDS